MSLVRPAGSCKERRSKGIEGSATTGEDPYPPYENRTVKETFPGLIQVNKTDFMGKDGKSLIKTTLPYFDELIEASGSTMAFQQYRYIRDYAFYGKTIANAERIPKKEYQLGLTALFIFEISRILESNPDTDKDTLLKKVSDMNHLSEEDGSRLYDLLGFFENERPPKDAVEKVLLDIRNIHLGLPDAPEKLALKRQQMEQDLGKKYSDLEWENFSRQFYLAHCFYTKYANENYGHTRSRNFTEIEKRIEKLDAEQNKGKKGSEEEFFLSDKEGENLFKSAFRNYINLVGLADRKAHLLIQVNAIIASVIIGLTIKRGYESSMIILPTAMILLVAGLTIFYSIMASKPLKKFTDFHSSRESFFFGSFDRLDPDFKNVGWEKYERDIKALFKSDKEMVFDELIKESYLVRKVLSKKFMFLSIAYKVFIVGQLLSIGVFIVLFIYGGKNV
jgi:Family of unknown function (DUF5706)